MRQLYKLECKKTLTSVVYWLYVVAITAVFWLNYGNADRDEINDASNPSSVFYCAKDGQYAAEQNNLSDKNVQNQMMLAVTRKLLHSYRDNSYEYYPFGYVKEKVFSESEQNIVLNYLQEITGMDKAEIVNDTKDRGKAILDESEEPKKLDKSEESEESKESEISEDTNNYKDSSEIEISGNGAYIAKPGTGSMNEAGQYEFRPDEWEYVENASDFTGEKEETDSKELDSAEVSADSRVSDDIKVSDDFKASDDSQNKESSSDFSIQVSYGRFMEIMDKVSGMIGRDSYFSRSLINLYYGENDMDLSDITLRQHEEFFEEDKITGAFARYYCDSIALAVLLLPAFVIAAVMAADRSSKVMELAYTKPVSGCKLIFIRYLANIGMMFVPILLLPLRSFIILARYANSAGHAIDIYAFPKYIIGWILPALLFVTALSLFLAVLTRSYISVLVMGVLWLFFKPSVGKIAGGNYELFDIAIRHNTLKGFGRMMQGFDMLVINRLCITGAAILLVLLSVWIYQVKRKGGLSFNVRELVHYHKGKL